MRTLRNLGHTIVKCLFTISGCVTSITILLIVFFLFREGAGLFSNSPVEKGYALCLHTSNPIRTLTSEQVRRIFDFEITNWSEVGGEGGEIMPFRFDEIFSMYPDEELGEDYALLPAKLEEVIAQNPDIIAFLPQRYLAEKPQNFFVLNVPKISWRSFLGGGVWMPTASPAAQFGALPLLLGTLWVGIFAILIALPFGLGVAIYLSELASGRMRGILKPVIELLAGIPSVVYGFFGLAVMVPLIQRTLGLPVGETAFAGSVILAIMALPTIITIAEDAMRSAPRAMREASLALGATSWQTIYRVVVPYASSGIMAAVVLGVGRAVGETMAALMVTGNAAVMPHTLFESVRTIPATIAAELGEAPTGGTHYQSLFLLGCILFLITLIVSVLAEVIGKKGRTAAL